MRLRSGIVILALSVIGLLTPAIVRADTVLSPFVGVTFGGDFPTHQTTWGGAVTFVGGALGLELEYGRTNNFLGGTQPNTDMTTLSANLVSGGALHGRGAKPYLVAGVGVFRTDVPAASTSNDLTFDLGLGVNVLVSNHVGFRGDVRYFRRLSGQTTLGIVPIATGFDFWRGIVGLNLMF